MQELIDIYDKDRTRTGLVVPRKGTTLSDEQFMLYVLALIEDASGRFLITQRSLDKPWGAGWWEVAGGGALAGESSEQAVRREVLEETGLVLDDDALAPVYSYRNLDTERSDNYFADIYHVRLSFDERQVRLHESEAIAVRMATWGDICALAAEGTFLHFERLRQALVADGTLDG